jgi:hypothetical protein
VNHKPKAIAPVFLGDFVWTVQVSLLIQGRHFKRDSSCLVAHSRKKRIKQVNPDEKQLAVVVKALLSKACWVKGQVLLQPRVGEEDIGGFAEQGLKHIRLHHVKVVKVLSVLGVRNKVEETANKEMEFLRFVGEQSTAENVECLAVLRPPHFKINVVSWPCSVEGGNLLLGFLVTHELWSVDHCFIFGV